MSGKQQKCCFFLSVLQPTRRREGGAVFKSPSKIGRWVGGIARWPPRAFEGRKARQASQSHSRATPKPTDRQPIGSQLRPQSHHKATPKPPQSHPRASCKPCAWKGAARSCTWRKFLPGRSPHREGEFGAPADCVRSCGCRSRDYLDIQREARKARGSRIKVLPNLLLTGQPGLLQIICLFEERASGCQKTDCP